MAAAVTLTAASAKVAVTAAVAAVAVAAEVAAAAAAAAVEAVSTGGSLRWRMFSFDNCFDKDRASGFRPLRPFGLA